MQPKRLLEALQNLSKAMTEVNAALEELRGEHDALASLIFAAHREGALGIELRRVGSGHRMTFGKGEHILRLECNSRIAWLTVDEPWHVEEQLIRSVSLPLNLDQNRHHSFHAELSARRRAAKERARQLPVLG